MRSSPAPSPASQIRNAAQPQAYIQPCVRVSLRAALFLRVARIRPRVRCFFGRGAARRAQACHDLNLISSRRGPSLRPLFLCGNFFRLRRLAIHGRSRIQPTSAPEPSNSISPSQHKHRTAGVQTPEYVILTRSLRSVYGSCCLLQRTYNPEGINETRGHHHIASRTPRSRLTTPIQLWQRHKTKCLSRSASANPGRTRRRPQHRPS